MNKIFMLSQQLC